MTLACVKNNLVFIKPNLYYFKVVSEPDDHNSRVFVWRIHFIVSCIVVKSTSFKKKKGIIFKNVEA